MNKLFSKSFMPAMLCGMLCISVSCNSANSNSANTIEAENVANPTSKTVVKRKLAYYKAIRTTGAFDVYFTQTNKASSIRIEGAKEDVESVTWNIDKNGVLNIGQRTFDRNFFKGRNKHELKVYVASPDLIAITSTGAGDVKVVSALDTDVLRIEQKGAGDVEFEKSLICDQLFVSLYGAGDADLNKVTAQTVQLELYGAGDMDVNSLRAEKADIKLQGAGDIDVKLDKAGTVNSTLYGVGTIELEGTVNAVNVKRFGSGNIDTSKLRVMTGRRPR